jgi:hypothetical protein
MGSTISPMVKFNFQIISVVACCVVLLVMSYLFICYVFLNEEFARQFIEFTRNYIGKEGKDRKHYLHFGWIFRQQAQLCSV